ncbi:MAG TPA: CopG family antitoxin [Nitrolancea sp.]|nr:CopG family antitoxin [Nitrolancea sp.]
MTNPKRQKPAAERPRIPEFTSREEEAEFWDTHDIADYWDDLKPVRVRFSQQLSEGITVRLDPETLARLRERARKLGVGPTTLARMWIIEQLRADELSEQSSQH